MLKVYETLRVSYYQLTQEEKMSNTIKFGVYRERPLYLVKTDYGIVACDEDPPKGFSEHYGNYVFSQTKNSEISPEADELPLFWGLEGYMKKEIAKLLTENDKEVTAVHRALEVQSLTGAEKASLLMLRERLINECWNCITALVQQFDEGRAKTIKGMIDRLSRLKDELAVREKQAEELDKTIRSLRNAIRNQEEDGCW